jgi:hypothetical protein
MEPLQGIWNRLRYERRQARHRLAPEGGEEGEGPEELEVEQKFEVPADCGARLVEAGAVLEGEAAMRDVYWDTPSLVLLARDHWLRQRCRPSPRPSGSPGTAPGS